MEVLSPSSQRHDRYTKFKLYQRAGVREYWLVDTGNRAVEVYLLREKKFILDEVYQIFPDYVKLTDEEKKQYRDSVPVSLYEDFSIPLENIFRNLF